MNTELKHLQIAGKILEIGTESTNEIGGNTWKKNEFVIQTDEKYPKTIHINVWGDNLLWLSRCNVGDFVTAMINISSKKSKDKWFTEIVAWRIDIDMLKMKQNLSN